MTNKGIDIKHPKLRGEWAELRFMARAAEHGLLVTKPWGDTARYDFAVEHKGKFVRVQVKSTMFKCDAGYRCNVVADGEPYESDALDFVAAYVIQEDVWYIIPAAAFKGQTRVRLYPGRKDAKYSRYEEAWNLLRGGETALAEAESEANTLGEVHDPPAAEENVEDENSHPPSFAEARMLAIRDRLFNNPRWRPRR